MFWSSRNDLNWLILVLIPWILSINQVVLKAKHEKFNVAKINCCRVELQDEIVSPSVHDLTDQTFEFRNWISNVFSISKIISSFSSMKNLVKLLRPSITTQISLSLSSLPEALVALFLSFVQSLRIGRIWNRIYCMSLHTVIVIMLFEYKLYNPFRGGDRFSFCLFFHYFIYILFYFFFFFTFFAFFFAFWLKNWKVWGKTSFSDVFRLTTLVHEVKRMNESAAARSEKLAEIIIRVIFPQNRSGSWETHSFLRQTFLPQTTTTSIWWRYQEIEMQYQSFVDQT